MITNSFLTYALNRTNHYKSSGSTVLSIGLLDNTSVLRTTQGATFFPAFDTRINLSTVTVTANANATISKIGVYASYSGAPSIGELIVEIDIPSATMVNGQLATIQGAGQTYFGLVNA